MQALWSTLWLPLLSKERVGVRFPVYLGDGGQTSSSSTSESVDAPAALDNRPARLFHAHVDQATDSGQPIADAHSTASRRPENSIKCKAATYWR